MNISLHVLIIEDAEDDAELLLDTLRQGGYDPISKRVDTADAMKAALHEQPIDAVISEYKMQHFSAPAALAMLKESDLDIPFIIVSDTRGEKTVVEALKAGAHDFLPKGEIPRLVPTLERELQESIARRALKQAESARLAEIQRRTEELERRVLERTAELNQTKDRITAILNSSSDAIIHASSDGVIQQVNPAFNDLLCYAKDEVFGQPLFIIATPDFTEKLTTAMHTVIHEMQPQRIEICVLCKDGREFDADLALAPIMEGEQIGSIVCNLRDMTERKRTEEKLQKALEREQEINELKTRFVSMVSHDIRTPLTIIQLSTEMLQKYYDRLDEARRARYFEKIQAQIKRMITLLNDVLTINQAEMENITFSPVRMSLDQICQGIVDDFQEMIDLEHELVYSCVHEPSWVLVDEKLVHQAITNLLTNAFKYSPGGSTVHVDLSFDESNAMIRVKDSGIGIPEADQEHLFDIFKRAGNVGVIEGTGLGLAIVKRSVETHGGTVMFESQVDIGTTFIVTLPLHQANTGNGSEEAVSYLR